ncbi:unnamed protein product [Cutaneotrichosporon oleaginosum]
MASRPPRPLYATPPVPPPSVPLSLALDPIPAPDEVASLGLFKKRNRSSLPISDAERFKNVYRADPGRPLFAASMTNLPRYSTSTRESAPSSPHLSPPSPSHSPQSPSRSGSGDSHSTHADARMYEPRGYEAREPLRASSAAHARVQRKLQRSAQAAAASTLSLSVVPEFEEERNHRVFADSRVGRWMRKLVRSKD